MDDDTNELILREIYYSPSNGFRSAENLYQQAKEEGAEVTRNFVKEWLKHQEIYTRFKSHKGVTTFKQTFVKDLGDQVQLDLIDMQKHGKENNDFRWILTGIEILSRYGFAIPAKRKLGSEIKVAMKIFLDEFHTRFNTFPKLMQFDEGSEFLNKDVIPLLKSHNITYFSSYSKRKAAVVERFNRTLKEKMMKMFYDQKNHNWVDHISDLVENYNSQVNRSIKEKPSDVNEENKHVIWMRLFGKTVGEIPKPKFKKGDLVRVLDKKLKKMYKKDKPVEINPKTGKPKRNIALHKKNEARFSDEVFVIDKVLLGVPVMYKLYSEKAEIEILGKFYERELSHVME